MPKELVWGYTTGTCAQAATKAAMEMLLTGCRKEKVQVTLPAGRRLELPVRDICRIYGEKGAALPSEVSCAVKKDSGNDPDVTNGVLVYSRVSRMHKKGVVIEGGEGIGRVTKPGLEQPVGTAAINRVPRMMIEKEVREALEEAGSSEGIRVEISIPEGVRLAEKTFNPRLGVEGGLSILGTSGLVEPMSEQALVDTIRVELNVKLAEGKKCLIIAPGNYGLDFLSGAYGIPKTEVIKCSNYIGQTIDMAKALGCGSIVLAGHIGKLIKVAGGIMNTHSRWADCRMELLAAAALKAGLSGRRAAELLTCNTTDDALAKCTTEERGKVMEQVMERMEYYLTGRAGEGMKIGAVTYSNVYGILGFTAGAEKLLKTASEKEGEKI